MNNKTEEQFTDVLMVIVIAALFGLVVGSGLGFIANMIFP